MENININNVIQQTDQQLTNYSECNKKQIQTLRSIFKQQPNKYGLLKPFYFEITPDDFLTFGTNFDSDFLGKTQEYQDVIFTQQILDPKDIDIFCKATIDIYNLLNETVSFKFIKDPNLTNCVIIGNNIIVCYIYFIPFNSILQLKQINQQIFQMYFQLSLNQDIMYFNYNKILRLIGSLKWPHIETTRQCEFLNNETLQNTYNKNKQICNLFKIFSISSIIANDKIVLFSNLKESQINKILIDFLYNKPIENNNYQEITQRQQKSIDSIISKSSFDAMKQNKMTTAQQIFPFGIIEQKKIHIQNTNQTFDSFMWIHPDFILTNFIQSFNTITHIQKFNIHDGINPQNMQLQIQHDINNILFQYYLHIFEKNVGIPNQEQTKQLLIINPQIYTDCRLQQQTLFSKIYQNINF